MPSKTAKVLWIIPYVVGVACYLVAPDSEAGTPTRAAAVQSQPAAPGQAFATGFLPPTLSLAFTWAGLSPTHPDNHDDLSLQADHQHYRNIGKHQVISYRGSGKTVKVSEIDKLVPIAPVQQLLAVLGKADWKAAQEAASVIEHTDDYPRFELGFALSEQGAVKLFSTSNTRTGAPWNLQIGPHLYVSQNQQIGPAVSKLFKAVS